jgi:hypothetical protein
MKPKWTKSPARGTTAPASQVHRYTVVRLSDMAERYTDRRPHHSTLSNPDRMTWDNQNQTEVRPA